MKQILSLLTVIVVSTMAVFGQPANYGKTWVHGMIRPYITDASVANFTPVFWDTIINTPLIDLEGNGSNICNASGTPIIVTNGFRVWDGNHNIMDNGDSICPNVHYALDAGSNQMQKTIILPVGDSIYYAFSVNISDSVRLGLKTLPQGGVDLLQYAVVDMKENNYSGKVTSKKNTILKDSSLATTEMAAVRHGNGKDWWLVKRGRHWMSDSTVFYVFRVKKDSIIGPFRRTYKAHNTRGTWIGQSVFNNKGDKFASVALLDTVFFADFDRCSGEFYNAVDINVTTISTIPPNLPNVYDIDSFATGLAFSPNDSFLYVSVKQGIAQYAVYDANMLANRQIIAGYDTVVSITPPVSSYGYFGLYLAPNGKIYTASGNPNAKSWSIIEYPNLYGLASGFCGRCQQFPKFGAVIQNAYPTAPPNMPNYGLGALPGACGSTLTVPQVSADVMVRLYPNPTDGVITLEDGGAGGRLELRDMPGRVVWQQQVAKGVAKHGYHLGELAPGVYSWSYEGADGSRQQGKLVVGK